MLFFVACIFCVKYDFILEVIPPKRRKGRPPRSEQRVKVWLGRSFYDLWKEKKDSLGYGKSTNSEFAELLLKGISISTPQNASSSETIHQSCSLSAPSDPWQLYLTERLLESNKLMSPEISDSLSISSQRSDATFVITLKTSLQSAKANAIILNNARCIAVSEKGSLIRIKRNITREKYTVYVNCRSQYKPWA